MYEVKDTFPWVSPICDHQKSSCGLSCLWEFSLFLRYACVATLKSCNQGKCCNPYSGIDTHLHVYEITGKSLSEALLFEEHGENMLCKKLF